MGEGRGAAFCQSQLRVCACTDMCVCSHVYSTGICHRVDTCEVLDLNILSLPACLYVHIATPIHHPSTIHLSVHPSTMHHFSIISPSIHQSTSCLSIHPSTIHLFIPHPSIHLSIPPFIHPPPSKHPFVSLFISPPTYPSVHSSTIDHLAAICPLSVHRSIRPSTSAFPLPPHCHLSI